MSSGRGPLPSLKLRGHEPWRLVSQPQTTLAPSRLLDEGDLIFTGAAYTMHREPAKANVINAGTGFTFGETHLEFFDGDWPEGYSHYKAFLNRKGYGLTQDDQSQVQWNVLYDLGWSYSKEAMETCNRLKPYFTHGTFIGIDGDETLHLHTLEDHPGGVLMAFNLTRETVNKTIRIPLQDLAADTSNRLFVNGKPGRIEGNQLIISQTIPAETPLLFEITTYESTDL